jgi:ketosteroid isomerase-like protein
MDLLEAPEGVPRDAAANSETFRTALARGDSAAATSVYHEAAVLVSPTGDVLSGRAAIERFWQTGIELGLGSVELEPGERFALGVLGYERGQFQLHLAPAADRAAVERGRYLIVHVQSQGSWRWAVTAFGIAGAPHERHVPTTTTGSNER